jgi:hypothetical protein
MAGANHGHASWRSVAGSRCTWNPSNLKVASMRASGLIAPAVSIAWLLVLGGCGQPPVLHLPADAAGNRPSSQRFGDTVTAPTQAGPGAQLGASPAPPAFDRNTAIAAETPTSDPQYSADGTLIPPRTTWDAAAPGTPASYEAAVKHCDALYGTEKTVCMNMAQAGRANR